jgi:hypothetical protein
MDGFADFADDPGCDSDSDATEYDDSGALVCDDGLDNETPGDNLVDYRIDGLGDPGCRHPTSPTESPQCQDGANNDGQPGTDSDGGESVLGPGNGDPNGADPQCVGKPWRNSERPTSCGLGFEPTVVLAALIWTRRRRIRA